MKERFLVQEQFFLLVVCHLSKAHIPKTGEPQAKAICLQDILVLSGYRDTFVPAAGQAPGIRLFDYDRLVQLVEHRQNHLALVIAPGCHYGGVQLVEFHKLGILNILVQRQK